jgi:hypothetical protein
VKTSTILALALGASLSAPLAAYAQTEQPAAPYHHYPVHHFQGPRHAVHHRFAAHKPAPALAPAPAAASATAVPQAQPFGLAWPRIAPYPDGKGDEDGLSEDPNECNKGCIDGNQD